jgi:hypothetical protein
MHTDGPLRFCAAQKPKLVRLARAYFARACFAILLR